MEFRTSTTAGRYNRDRREKGRGQVKTNVVVGSKYHTPTVFILIFKLLSLDQNHGNHLNLCFVQKCMIYPMLAFQLTSLMGKKELLEKTAL